MDNPDIKQIRGSEDLIEKIKQCKNRKTRFRILNNYLSDANLLRNGLWLEFGVYKGETINQISQFCDKVYGFDSFYGLPEYWIKDHDKGYFNMDGIPPTKINDNVELIIGLFQDTLDDFIKNNIEDKYDQITFINFDCDLYSSTKFVLDKLKKYIKKGTILYFDELIVYDIMNSEFRALSEFIHDNNIDYKLHYRNCQYQLVVEIL